jgi:hypothetical protein
MNESTKSTTGDRHQWCISEESNRAGRRSRATRVCGLQVQQGQL